MRRGAASWRWLLSRLDSNAAHPHLLLFCVSAPRRYASVKDLGSPSDAANRLLDRYLNKEFMSTRLGVRRAGEVLSASSREKDGRTYYDIDVSPVGGLRGP